jgi:DNA-binding CsgD family transcriptional regulator
VVVTYFVGRDWRLCAIAALGVLAVRVAAGVVLHGTHPPARQRFPGLTQAETQVAWYVFRGRGDPAIARRTGFSLRRVGAAEESILRKWSVRSREEIATHVAQILREPQPHRPDKKQRREWMGEFTTGLAIVGVGVAMLALPSDTVLVGGVRDWLGVALCAAGLVFVLVSTVTYLWEIWRR